MPIHLYTYQANLAVDKLDDYAISHIHVSLAF